MSTLNFFLMKRVGFLIFAIFFSSVAIGQSFALEYAHTIRQKKLPSANFSDSIQLESDLPMDSLDLKQMLNNAVMEMLAEIHLLHKVKVIQDTTFIETVSDDDFPNTTFIIPNANQKVYKNDFVRLGQSTNKKPSQKIHLVANDSFKVIMGYSCQLYVSSDKTYNIWFCKNLPSSITPGLSGLWNYPGAILEYTYSNLDVFESVKLTKFKSFLVSL